MPQQPTTTPEQRLAELRRELQMKQQHYTGWVRDGKLTQRTADHREQVIRDVLADLEKLYQVPPQPAQGQLFAPEQLPAPKHQPSRGHYADH